MSTRRPRHNFGRADWIGVEALGVPGQRTFRLLVLAQDTSVHLWLEKEQLQALADALARLVAEIDAAASGSIPGRLQEIDVPGKPPGFPDTPDIELNIGALGLRFDPQRELVALEVFDRGGDDADPPVFRCLATRDQVEGLHRSCAEVIASGRPRCPFCGAPLPGQGVPHFCPPTNGHQKLTSTD